jgi:hypothetical protein
LSLHQQPDEKRKKKPPPVQKGEIALLHQQPGEVKYRVKKSKEPLPLTEQPTEDKPGFVRRSINAVKRGWSWLTDW